MRNVCELSHLIEQETQPVEPIFDEPPDEEESLSRPARVIASVGAWLVERFANVPGPSFIEDGRLAAYSRELRSPAAQPETTEAQVEKTEKILH